MKIKFCLISIILILVAVCGCKKTESAPQPEPEIMLQPEQIAQFLCKYSRGSFPNWILYQDYDKYLTKDESQAIQFIAENLKNAIAPSGRPKQLAIARFLANHTECIPVPEENSAFDNPSLKGYVFEQHTPIIPNVPEVPIIAGLSDADTSNLYIDNFEKFWDGSKKTRKIQIIIKKTESDSYVINTHIAQTYARQLRKELFWRSMDDEWYNKASEILNEICQNDAELCESLTPFMESANSFNKNSHDQFEAEIKIGQIHFKMIATNHNSSYTVAYFTLTNNGSKTYRNIIFTTDETPPQHCELQASQNNRHDNPLILPPGQTLQAWCALSSDTMPTIQLSYYTSR